eukprot:11287167-Prorocentrum_lima.AAC.1
MDDARQHALAEVENYIETVMAPVLQDATSSLVCYLLPLRAHPLLWPLPASQHMDHQSACSRPLT